MVAIGLMMVLAGATTANIAKCRLSIRSVSLPLIGDDKICVCAHGAFAQVEASSKWKCRLTPPLGLAILAWPQCA